MFIVSQATRRLVQTILNERLQCNLTVDGEIGPKTIAAAKQWLGSVADRFRGTMNATRWCAAVLQLEAQMRSVEAGALDAFYGPQTDDAAERLAEKIMGVAPTFTRPDDKHAACSTLGSTIECRNPSTAEFLRKYGMVGMNQEMVISPYPLRLDWDLDTTTTKFSAHRLLVRQMEAAMLDILKHYGLDAIERLGLNRFGGCLNVRNKRGGDTPSVHSWGAAIDWFPSMNQLKQNHNSALFAKAPYEPFLHIWEQHGFMSLGRCYDFDWMHVQCNP